MVTISETLTVKELSEEVAISPSQIIKTLMEMGITATANQALDPEVVKLLAVEFDFDVEVISPEEVGALVGDFGDPIQLAPSEPIPDEESGGTARGRADTLPIPKVVKIPEALTVKELSEKVGISPSEIIKAMMKMGIMATLNQNLDPELVKQVAVEFAFNVQIIPVEEVQQYSRASQVEAPDIPWLEPSTPKRARRDQESAPNFWRNNLWLSASAMVVMVLLFLALPRGKGTLSPTATSPVVDEGQRRVEVSPGSTGSPTPRQSRTYREDIQPLIASYCHKCHGPNQVAAGIRLQTYRQIMRYVEPGRSEESRLYTFIQQRKNHVNPWPRSWGQTTNEKLAVIKDWIDVNWGEE